jgi:tetratricopeptide (TPR) repeat protein
VGFQELFNSAYESAKSGNYVMAVQEYENARRALPADHAGLTPEDHAKTLRSIAFNLAQILNKLGRYREALENVDLGLAQKPTAHGKAIAFAARGEALYGLERPIEGKEMFEEAVRAHPVTGRLNSAESMIRIGASDLIVVAGQWIEKVVSLFGDQLNEMQRLEVESLRHQFVAKSAPPLSTSSKESAQILVDRAKELSRDPGKLTQAADLLEQALSQSPELREKHANRLQLWRKGVAM